MWFSDLLFPSLWGTGKSSGSMVSLKPDLFLIRYNLFWFGLLHRQRSLLECINFSSGGLTEELFFSLALGHMMGRHPSPHLLSTKLRLTFDWVSCSFQVIVFRPRTSCHSWGVLPKTWLCQPPNLLPVQGPTLFCGTPFTEDVLFKGISQPYPLFCFVLTQSPLEWTHCARLWFPA